MKSHAIALGIDTLWMLYSGYQASSALLSIQRFWKLSKQNRGGHEIMRLNSDLYPEDMTAQLGGVVSGTLIYGIYKMFLCQNDVKSKKSK